MAIDHGSQEASPERIKVISSKTEAAIFDKATTKIEYFQIVCAKVAELQQKIDLVTQQKQELEARELASIGKNQIYFF